jgi:peptidoglycan hydrolase-like protein with peptidoglycan-binding domain
MRSEFLMRFNRNAMVVATCTAMFMSVVVNMMALQADRRDLPSTAGATKHVVSAETFASHDIANGHRRPVTESGPRARLKAIQRELRRLGYAPGNLDGVRDHGTEAAIVAFEYDHGLPLRAEPSDEILQALVMGLPRNPGLSPSGASPAARQLIQTVQASLTRLGFEVGGIDGRMGPQTRRAILAFEDAQGLQRTGRVSSRLLTALASQSVTRRMSMVQAD